jgi:D-arginine dehydrogenase
MVTECDVIVIGGGIAGASAGAQLAEHNSVILLEKEKQPGYHSTGRSAAVYSQTYGNDTVRALTLASRSFFYEPPQNFCEAALVKPRKVLVIARAGQEAVMDALLQSASSQDDIEHISVRAALDIFPILNPDGLIGQVLSKSPADIEVHELLQGYLRLLKTRNGVIRTDCEVI